MYVWIHNDSSRGVKYYNKAYKDFKDIMDKEVRLPTALDGEFEKRLKIRLLLN